MNDGKIKPQIRVLVNFQKICVRQPVKNKVHFLFLKEKKETVKSESYITSNVL